MKNSPWEGGMHGTAAIWSPLIKKPQRVATHLMHISDWLPTFYSAAGLNVSELGNIDGVDMWKAISENSSSPRTELVYNIDDIDNYAAVRRGDWKYIYGTTARGKLDMWYGSSGIDPNYSYDEDAVLKSEAASALAGVITNIQIREKHTNMENENSNIENFSVHVINKTSISKLRGAATLKCPEINKDDLPEHSECKPLESPCLFNIKEDPCERINVAEKRPTIVQNLENMVINYRKTAIKPRNIPRDLNADPSKWNNTWINWQDCDEIEKYKAPKDFWSPFAIALVTIAGIAFLIVLSALITISVKKSKLPKMMPVYTSYEDPMDLPSTELKTKFKDQAFEDHETTTHHSFKEALKSIE